MSGFFGGTKRFALPILSLVILAAVSSDANAEKTGKDKSSTTPSSLAFLSDWLDVLDQYGRAAKRLADPRQVMLIRVVDAAGEPIAGASVRSFTITHIPRGSSTSLMLNTLEDTLCLTAFTHADGTARVVRPTSKEQGVDVRVRADGYVPLSARWNEYARTAETIPSEFTFTLEPSQPIGGVVHDASGRPIAGAEVSLTLQDNNPNTRIKADLWSHEEHTDAEGRWRCRHTPSELAGLSITVEHADIPPLELNQSACANQREKLQAEEALFVTAEAMCVQGRVTDSRGNAVASALVSITQYSAPFSSRTNNAWTDDDGRYRFLQARSGPCTIAVSARGLVSQRRSIEVEPDLAPADFCLKPGSTVKIRVVDPEGNPVAGAEVVSEGLPFRYEANILADSDATDSDGRWASSNEPEDAFALAIRKQGYAAAYREVAAGDHEYLITLRPPVRISGRVINAATREPIQKVFLSTHHTPPAGTLISLTYPTVAVNPEGTYEVTFDDDRGIDRVTWQLYVQSPGYVSQRTREFETREGSQTMDIELLPGPAVAGVVKRPDGTPVAGASVFVSNASSPVTIRDGRVPKCVWPPSVVDAAGADGRFELPKPLEPYVVGVVHDSGGAEIAADVLESRGEIVLQPWARVEGEFRGPWDESLWSDGEERILLGINCAEDADSDKANKRPYIDWSCTCDVAPSPRFVFERVRPGRAEAEVFSSGPLFIAGEVAPVWRTQKFTAVAGQTSHIIFSMTGRTVTGHVALPAGRAREFAPAVGCGLLAFQRPLVPVPPEIAGQPAEVREAWERQWLESEAGMAADRAAQNHWFKIEADGSFKMDGVASGVYSLAVELCKAGETPDEPGEEIAWLVEEVTIPDAACDKPFDLDTFTLNVASLFCGDAAPDFEFQTADGQTHRLSEYRGRKVILRFGDKWDAMDGMGDPAEATERLLSWYGGGPIVWINLTSDTKPRPAIEMVQDAEFQYVQGYVPPTAEAWKAYDVHRPRSEVIVHVAQDGTVITK